MNFRDCCECWLKLVGISVLWAGQSPVKKEKFLKPLQLHLKKFAHKNKKNGGWLVCTITLRCHQMSVEVGISV